MKSFHYYYYYYYYFADVHSSDVITGLFLMFLEIGSIPIILDLENFSQHSCSS